MNRLTLKDNQTTVVQRYGFWDHTSPPASCLYLGASPAQAITPTITQSFSVPIQTPAKVCVAVNGEAKCSPVVHHK
jgi:hypothetical protein